MSTYKVKLLISMLIIMPSFIQAQSNYKLLKSIPLNDARFLNSDNLGNIYVIQEKNELIQYSQDGDSTGSFKSTQNGSLKSIDVKNPMRMLLFYDQFSKIVLLDRMLAPKSEIDLKRINLFQVSAAGVSNDGNIWLYNDFDAKLIKINEQQQRISESNDLRLETQTIPQPQSLTEDNGVVYLCDPMNGIFTFDRFAAFLNTLPFKGIAKLQVVEDQLIFLKDEKLHIYNMKSFEEKEMRLPTSEGLIDFRVERSRLYLLHNNKLEIFRLE